MIRVLVLYNQPADAAAFDQYYFETHVPKAKKLPGLKSYVVSSTEPGILGGTLAPYLIAELEFENAADLQAALASPEGLATVEDLSNFAQAGVSIMTFGVRTL